MIDPVATRGADGRESSQLGQAGSGDYDAWLPVIYSNRL